MLPRTRLLHCAQICNQREPEHARSTPDLDLIAFALTTYIYRTERGQELLKRLWIVVGSFAIVGVFFSGLIFTSAVKS